MLVLACVLWGLSFPLIKVLDLEQNARLPGVSGAFFASWLQMARFALAAMILLPWVARLRLTRREWVQGAWLAFWGGFGMALQAWGLGHTEASTSAFLTQAYCVILPLVACMKTRRRPSRRTLVATAMVVAGGAILSGIQPGHLKIGKGEAATLVAALAFTFQILTLENPKYAGNRGMPVTFAMSVCIAAMFLPVSLVLAPDPALLVRAGASLPTFAIVLSLACFCSVGAYGLMCTWQPRVPATEAGLIYTTEPIFASAFAMFLPGMLVAFTGQAYANESLTVSLFAGGSLILAANVLMQWKRPPHHSPTT